MLLHRTSAACALMALVTVATWASAEPVVPNIASASDLKEWMRRPFQRQSSLSEVDASRQGSPPPHSRSRPDFKKFYGDLKSGHLFRKNRDASAVDLHHQPEEESDWRKGILSKYAGQHGTNYKMEEGRAYGSLPPSKVSGPITGIEARVKERKALKKSNVWSSETGLGKGLGFSPYMENPVSQKAWAQHQKYSEDFTRKRFEEKQEERKKEAKPPMRMPSFKVPDSRRPKKIKFQSDDRNKEAAWQGHYSNAHKDIKENRGDALLHHRHYNSDVAVQPNMARQSFAGREDNSMNAKAKKFDMYNRQSLPSDGRYGGEGAFLGKSPVAMGAEGPKGKSILSQGDPNYRQGMYQQELRGTASEQDDVHSTMMKPKPRLQNWKDQRESVAQ